MGDDAQMSEAPHWFERLKYPVEDPYYIAKVVRANKCPQCGTDLDTGWECTNYRDCGYDAISIYSWLAAEGYFDEP